MAGIYAFIPIEEATALHNTINSFVVPQVVVLATDTAVAQNNNYRLSCDANYTLLGMHLDATGIGGDEDIDLDFENVQGMFIQRISLIQDNLFLNNNGNNLLGGQGPIGAGIVTGSTDVFRINVNAGTYTAADTIGGQAYVITTGSCTFTELT